MELVSRLANALAVIGALCVVTAGSALAENDPNCGQNDLAREPASFAFIAWRKTSTSTTIIPRGIRARAVLGRFVSGQVRYFYGPWVTNPHSRGTQRSHVSATIGVNVGSYYQPYGTRPGAIHPVYDDYPRLRCLL